MCAAILGPEFGSEWRGDEVLTFVLGNAGLGCGPRDRLAVVCQVAGLFSLSQLFFLFSTGAVIVSSVMNVVKVVGSSKNMKNTVLVALPLPIAFAFSVLYFARLDAVSREPFVCVAVLGLHFFFVLNRVLIARITIMPFNYLNPVSAIPVFLYFSTYVLPPGYSWTVFWGSFAALVLINVHFVLNVIDLMTTHLGIRCLRIPYSLESSRAASALNLHELEEKTARGMPSQPKLPNSKSTAAS